MTLKSMAEHHEISWSYWKGRKKGPVPGLLQYLKGQYRRRNEQKGTEVGGTTGAFHALEAKSRKCFEEITTVSKSCLVKEDGHLIWQDGGL